MTIMVFKAPGPEKIHGHLVQYKVLPEGEQVEQHLADGWHMTAIAAGEAKLAADAAEGERLMHQADDNAAATRDEIEQKLSSMNVVFDRRLGTLKLTALLEEELRKTGDKTAAPAPSGKKAKKAAASAPGAEG